MAASFDTIDSYVASLQGKPRAFAEQLRGLIREAVPEATEAIKHGMPAFQIDGRSFLYFAIWKKHAGLYPVYRRSPEFEARVGPYRAKKDTVQFSFDRPLPAKLVTEIAQAQAQAAD